MTATRIFLVRHGATELSAEDAFAGGGTDVPLSDIGRGQLQKLAVRLAGETIAAVYASPLGRTMETARILAAPHRLPVTPKEGLREISHGHWEGKTRAVVEKEYPKEYALWNADPFSFAPPGGRDRPRGHRPGASSAARDRRGASGRAGPRRVAQGHDPAADRLAPRVRPASLPRPSRPEPGLPEHPRLQGRLARAAFALQRHLALFPDPVRHRRRRERTPVGYLGEGVEGLSAAGRRTGSNRDSPSAAARR